MSMIIGKKVLFIERVPKTEGYGGFKNIEHEGIVLDKFRDFVTEDKKIYWVDFYLVQLTNGKTNGLIHHFRPHQANRILDDVAKEEKQLNEFNDTNLK
jgi:hypothetical protein